jgi:hypothetical protein
VGLAKYCADVSSLGSAVLVRHLDFFANLVARQDCPQLFPTLCAWIEAFHSGEAPVYLGDEIGGAAALRIFASHPVHPNRVEHVDRAVELWIDGGERRSLAALAT